MCDTPLRIRKSVRVSKYSYSARSHALTHFFLAPNGGKISDDYFKTFLEW